MAGNVSEWCLNLYDPPSDTSLSTSEVRAVRGDSWSFIPGFMRASARYSNRPDYRNDFIGFRVLCSSSIE